MKESNRNKILVVTHSCVLLALTSPRLERKYKKDKLMFSEYKLSGGTYFKNCEAIPWHFDVEKAKMIHYYHETDE